MEAIHDDVQAKADQAAQDAQTRLQQAQDAGQANIAATDSATQAALDQARGAQTAAAEPIRGAAPEVLGEAMRQPLTDLNAQAKASEGRLYDAVDPDNTLVASSEPIHQAAERAYGSLSPTAQAFISEPEKTFLGLIGDYNPTESYRQVADLSSELAKQMRTERVTNQGITPAYRRMKLIMDGVKSALHDTVSQRVAEDRQAVASGQMAQEDTAVARLAQHWGVQVEREAANAEEVFRGLELVLSDFPEREHSRILADWEQDVRQRGELDKLRAIREYRKKHFPPPTPKSPLA